MNCADRPGVEAAAPSDGVATTAFSPRKTATAVPTDRVVWVTLAVLWALVHPFIGIDGDSRIYMGRALADIDPSGVGRDIMFTMDGQSNFTIFRMVASTLAARIGLGGTVVVLSLVNLAAWFVAIAVVVRAITPGRAGMVVLAAAIVLPRFYTPWNLFSAGESIPEPRPLAEACVLLAIAALLHGRLWFCLLGLVAAALFHPIMAAPGFGVFFIVLTLRDRRWMLGALALGMVVIVAGFLGLPLASRLTATMDNAWRAILLDRNPYLFLTRWPLETMGPVLVRAVTLALACLWLDKAVRTVLLASCGVALIGVATSIILGDGLFDTLVVQAQLWRALWLPTVLSDIAAGLCLVHLPRRGAAGQITLCFLAVAWIALANVPIGPVAALLAFAAFIGVPRLPFVVSPTTILAIGAGSATVGVAILWTPGAAIPVIVASMPGLPVAWSSICALGLLVAPVLALTMAWWHRPDAAACRAGARLLLAGSVGLLATQWYARTPAQADVDAAIVKPDLAAHLAQRPGAVLWTEGDEAWTWLHQANWNGQIQGSSIVFSRELALKWRARAESVVKAGLASDYLLRPFAEPAPSSQSLDVPRIKTFCAAPGRPAWIVAPIDNGSTIPRELASMVWSPPYPRGRRVTTGDRLRWLSFDHYAVIPCSDGTPREVSGARMASVDRE